MQTEPKQTEKKTNFWKEYRAYQTARKQQEKEEKKLRREERKTLDPEQRAQNRKERAEKRKKETVLKWEILSWVITLATALIAVAIVKGFIAEAVRVEGWSMSNTLQNQEIVLESKLDYIFGSPQRGDIVICHYPNRGGTLFVKRLVALPGDTVQIRPLTESEWTDQREEIEAELTAWVEQIRVLNYTGNDVSHMQDVQTMKSQAEQIEQTILHQDYKPETHNKLKFIFVKDGSGDGDFVRLPIPENMGLWPEFNLLTYSMTVTLEPDQYYVVGDNRGNSNDSRRVGALDRSYILGKVRYVLWPFTGWRNPY